MDNPLHDALVAIKLLRAELTNADLISTETDKEYHLLESKFQ